jgi:hypothetical protein
MQRVVCAEIDEAEDHSNRRGRNDQVGAGPGLAARGEGAHQLLAEPRLCGGEIFAGALGLSFAVVFKDGRKGGAIGQTEQGTKAKLQQQPALDRRRSHDIAPQRQPSRAARWQSASILVESRRAPTCCKSHRPRLELAHPLRNA